MAQLTTDPNPPLLAAPVRSHRSCYNRLDRTYIVLIGASSTLTAGLIFMSVFCNSSSFRRDYTFSVLFGIVGALSAIHTLVIIRCAIRAYIANSASS